MIKYKNFVRCSILLLFCLLIFFVYYYSTTTIHIIRHGEKVIEPGVQDAPLTDNGKAQSAKLGKYLVQKKHIENIYTSPMRRAKETAEIISLHTGSSLTFDDRLVEKNYRRSGDFYPDGSNVHIQGLPDGTKETREQHLDRLIKFFKDNISIYNKEIYIVAHGGLVNRVFEKIAKDNASSVEKHNIPYTSIFTFRYNKITKSFLLLSIYSYAL